MVFKKGKTKHGLDYFGSKFIQYSVACYKRLGKYVSFKPSRLEAKAKSSAGGSLSGRGPSGGSVPDTDSDGFDEGHPDYAREDPVSPNLTEGGEGGNSSYFY
ncbi:MAG: hypothetical protein PHH54_01095 [Candidatus Nanoarchaeia archaeon]|nr:hypothetical protein [Candidatus Nanoarchaeia archaeon]MDD5740560.1 hypothetical protein [Candidatus Nanoarchaeia archaeon]